MLIITSSDIYLSIGVWCAIITIGQCQTSNGHCIWYGECLTKYTETREHVYNCAYNGPAKLLNNTAASDILLKRCPHLYKSSNY